MSIQKSFASVLLLALVLVAGCSSVDRQIIHARDGAPMSVALVDTVTNDAVWNIDVPADHTIVLNFDNDADGGGFSESKAAPTSASYKIYRTADVETAYVDGNGYWGKSPVESGNIDLPASQVMIEPTFGAPVEAAPQPAVEEEVMAEQVDVVEPIVEDATEEVTEAVEADAEVEVQDATEEAAEVEKP